MKTVSVSIALADFCEGCVHEYLEVRDAADPLEIIGYRALGDKADFTEAYSISQRPTI
jgi:hypothetical protein